MPPIKCSSCAAVFRSRQQLPIGMKVKCPVCGDWIAVGDSPAPAETAAEPDPGRNVKAAAPASVPMNLQLARLEDSAKIQDGGPTDIQDVDDDAIVVETACPSCGYKGHVPEKFLGKKVKCRKCSNLFTVAEVKDAPSAAGGDSQDADGAAESDDLAVVVETVCPSCGTKGVAPEKVLGKNVKCRKCSSQFTVTKPARKKPVAAPATAEAVEEAAVVPRRPRRRRDGDDDDKWPISVIVSSSKFTQLFALV